MKGDYIMEQAEREWAEPPDDECLPRTDEDRAAEAENEAIRQEDDHE